MNLRPDTLKGLLLNIGLVVVLFLLLLVVVFYKILPGITNKDREVTVPDLTGMSVDEAVAFLNKRELSFSIGDSTYQSSMPSRTVVDQFPASMSRVKVHRKISLRLNASRPPIIKFPDLDAPTVEFARKQLLLLELQIGDFQSVRGIRESIVTEFRVNGEVMHAGDPVRKGTRVDMTVEFDTLRNK